MTEWEDGRLFTVRSSHRTRERSSPYDQPKPGTDPRLPEVVLGVPGFLDWLRSVGINVTQPSLMATAKHYDLPLRTQGLKRRYVFTRDDAAVFVKALTGIDYDLWMTQRERDATRVLASVPSRRKGRTKIRDLSGQVDGATVSGYTLYTVMWKHRSVVEGAEIVAHRVMRSEDGRAYATRSRSTAADWVRAGVCKREGTQLVLWTKAEPLLGREPRCEIYDGIPTLPKYLYGAFMLRNSRLGWINVPARRVGIQDGPEAVTACFASQGVDPVSWHVAVADSHPDPVWLRWRYPDLVDLDSLMSASASLPLEETTE